MLLSILGEVYLLSRSIDDVKELPYWVKKVLKEFAKRVHDVLGDAEIYLFGSYARGDWLVDSDIDLVVISPKFEGLDFGKRYSLLRKLLPKDRGFEILAYTPREFEYVKKKSIVIQDAMEYWIRVV